ncbi:MAG: RHS repeat-associated core domain-containing protein, partial [Myxococcales bacterium]|nr:RHS repeat-associated core domain-containing protein [Myxococcales bacterium]
METGLSETQRGAPRPLATRTPLGPHRRHQNGRQRLAALGDVVVPARQQRRRRGAPVAPRLALAARGLRRDDRAPAPTTRSTTTIWRASVFSCPIPRSPEENAHQEILYEEYHPHGTSAYRSSNGSVDVSARRYRYTGKERDEETGLYYNGARYLAAWLGRWTSADPVGIGADGPGLYNYTRGSPVKYTDPSGTDSVGDLVDRAGALARGAGEGVASAISDLADRHAPSWVEAEPDGTSSREAWQERHTHRPVPHEWRETTVRDDPDDSRGCVLWAYGQMGMGALNQIGRGLAP